MVAPIGISHEHEMQLVISSFITTPFEDDGFYLMANKNPRLAPRVCRRLRVLGSAQIAENRALLEDPEAANAAGGEVFPRDDARPMMGFAKDPTRPADCRKTD